MRSTSLVGVLLFLLVAAPRCHGQTPDGIEIPGAEQLPDGDLGAPATEPQEFDNDPAVDLPVSNAAARRGAPGDWNEASPGEERVSEVIRAHWVNLNQEGQLVGRISVFDAQDQFVPVANLQIRFVREGTTVATTRTDETGRFVVSTLRPDVYTLVAEGPNGFLGYSLEILSFVEAQRRASRDPIRLAQLEQVEASLEIDAAAVPPTFSTLKRIVRRYYPDIRMHNVAEAAYEPVVQRDEREAVEGSGTPAGPARRRGASQLQQELPPSRDATSIRSHQVALLPDGRMLGRMHGIDRLTGRPKLIEDVNVFLLQNDRLVDRVRVDRYGVFEVPNLQPGAYALVAAGRDGFGAVGFQLVPAAPGANAGMSPRWDPIQWAMARPRALPERLVQFGLPNEVPFPFAMALIDDPRDVRAAFSANNAPAPLANNNDNRMGPPSAPMGGPGGAPGGSPGGAPSGSQGGFSNGARSPGSPAWRPSPRYGRRPHSRWWSVRSARPIRPT